MIKMVIFDLDGVLVDARELHYVAFNKALATTEFTISPEEHALVYEGLPTRKKLERLQALKNFPADQADAVWELKQKYTIEMISDYIKPVPAIVETLKQLQLDGYRICVASNSIRTTIKVMLECAGLTEYVEFLFSNEDVVCCKPHAEIYLRCFLWAKLNPTECLIVEDSLVGRQAAYNSGAFTCFVNSSNSVSYELIKHKISMANGSSMFWSDYKLNVVIPMAGEGKRFLQHYSLPKFLIDVNGKPMIQMVVENLKLQANYIFLTQKSHYEKYGLEHFLKTLVPGCKIICTNGVTEGAACTVLLAKEFIDSNDPLLIVNSDQLIEWDANSFYSTLNSDGSILTFRDTHPKWSFCVVDGNQSVRRVEEKNPVSDVANVGIYYWKKGGDYVKYAQQMIDKNIRTNGEFYVAPVYNQAIEDGKTVKHFDVAKMWGLGTPEDLQFYLDNNAAL